MKAVIFDLDGVIVSTDLYHFEAWKEICDQEEIPFNKEINKRLRGVSRLACVDILLENASRNYTQGEKEQLAARKNKRYVSNIEKLTALDILPGVNDLLKDFKNSGMKLAIGSSSKNTALILEKLGLTSHFDAVVSGHDIKKSKPDPEVFLLAAERLKEEPQQCIVIEDASAGVEAAVTAGMKVVGVGDNIGNTLATLKVASLTDMTAEKIKKL
ncbi:beta-phosphoglucomutase [Bacillus sp. WMMC1349]|uniref:beta-phosphoglucomutase n=1 Tax=Bacillus sp. WMMC1349 TaxID=2736254 RepID=UPI00155728C8|nr:beta-phosphoglucomutase [Bacillus sp. WMMC1349]NPC91946.1 beta-phosphoglucomutase [Bacillus sp. WMMC1349]